MCPIIPSLSRHWKQRGTTNLHEINPLYDANGLRQIRALQSFVDVVTNNSASYELRFYPRSAIALFGTNDYGTNNAGFYDLQTNATPFVVWRISNPDTNGATNRIQFEEIRGTNSWTSLISYSSNTTTWRLEYGAGSEQRIEERRIAFVNSPIADRLETNVVMNASNQVAFICVERYHPYEWGWELISTVTDPDGAALTTTYAHHDDNLPSTGYGQLKHVIYPDGYWEKREYHNGYLRRIFNPWEDTPEHPDDATLYNSKFTEYGGVLNCDYVAIDALDGTAATHFALYNNLYMYSGVGAFLYRNENTAWLSSYYNNEELTPYDIDEETHMVGGIGGQFSFSNYNYTQTGDDWHPGSVWKKSVYNNKTSEFFNGMMFATQTGWDGIVAFAQHQGEWDGAEFAIITNATASHWRSMQVFSPQSGEFGDTVVWEIDGHAARPHFAIPGITTNLTTYLREGCKISERAYLYWPSTNNVVPTNSVLLCAREFLRDGVGRLLEIQRIDPTSGITNVEYTCVWNGPLKASETDANGATTLFHYDSAKRLTRTVKLGWSGLTGIADQPATTNAIVLNAAGMNLSETATTGSITRNTTTSYDLSKRTISQTTPTGTTEWTYLDNGRTVATTNSAGVFTVNSAYLDRRPRSNEGTAMVPQFFTHHVIRAPFTWGRLAERAYTVQRFAAVDSPRLIASILDTAGRPAGTNCPSWNLTNGVRTYVLYEIGYHSDATQLGEGNPASGYQAAEAAARLAIQRSYRANYNPVGFSDSGTDLLPPATNATFLTAGIRTSVGVSGHVILDGGHVWRVTTNSVCLNPSDDSPTHLQIVSERITGFTSNLVAEVRMEDFYRGTNTVLTYLDRNNQTVTEVASSSTASNLAVKVTVGGWVMSESTLSQPVATLNGYDVFGRKTAMTTPTGITLYTTYDPQLDLKLSETDFAGNTNHFEYYPTNHINAQQMQCQTDSRGKKTYFAYNSRNQLVQSWGDVPYPEQRVYNDYGEMVELHTFRGGTNWQSSSWPTNDLGTPDITRWTYQELTGLLFEKIDAKSNKWVYTYDDFNRQAATIWSRLDGTNTLSKTNVYNGFGEVVAVHYSDGYSVALNDIDRLGLPNTIIDNSGEHTLTYDPIGRVLADAFDGITNSYTYNQFGRTSLSLAVGTNTVTQTNTYDSATGRLLTMGTHGVTATYSYLTNSELVSGITFDNGSSNVLTTAKTFEYSSRLKSITNTLAGGPNISSHVYLYDTIHRRTNATMADGSYWRYGYDDRSQLTSAKHYWSGGTPVAGQQYEYSYDSIGNRTTTQSGGNQFGTSLRQTTWTVNELNQTITNAAYGYVNIFGEADASATVTVNHESVYRNGEFFRKEMLFSNSSGPVYTSITNVAVINNYGTNGEDIVDQVIGNVWVPKNPETLLYDEDGNLIQDSRWVYRWDAENRLKEMETLAGLATNVPVQKLVFNYDHQGRRASKGVYAWDAATTNYLLSSLTRFVYDGWNLLAELDVPQGTNAPVLTKSFLWGLDLSSTPDEAGGIGGLLAVSQHSTNGLAVHLPAFDGNGNVMALVHAGSGQPSARYEYAPFGEPLRVTGDAALLNPFRFSTKYTDDETGLLYYGYRYYCPMLAKWLNRDPLGESGGLSLYAFCQNNPINRVDIDGRLAPLAIAYVIFEIAMAAWDLWDAIDTIADPDADFGDQIMSVGGLAVGTIAPGGGYGTAAKAVAGKGKAVIGHFSDDYVRLAEELGARKFNVPSKHFDKLSDADKWAANERFLARTVARGDEVVLATPLNQVRPGSTLQREIDYLLRKGYRLSADGKSLIL